MIYTEEADPLFQKQRYTHQRQETTTFLMRDVPIRKSGEPL